MYYYTAVFGIFLFNDMDIVSHRNVGDWIIRTIHGIQRENNKMKDYVDTKLYYCECCESIMLHYIDEESWEENKNITATLAICAVCDKINAKWLNLEEK